MESVTAIIAASSLHRTKSSLMPLGSVQLACNSVSSAYFHGPCIELWYLNSESPRHSSTRVLACDDSTTLITIFKVWPTISSSIFSMIPAHSSSNALKPAKVLPPTESPRPGCSVDVSPLLLKQSPRRATPSAMLPGARAVKNESAAPVRLPIRHSSAASPMMRPRTLNMSSSEVLPMLMWVSARSELTAPSTVNVS